MVAERIIETLNQDPKTRRLLKKFNAVAKRMGLTDKEYGQAREIVLFLAIVQSKEVMTIMEEEVNQKMTK
jgi:pantoate kinase